MTCAEIRDRLLDDDDQAYLEPEIREHLEECHSCNQLFEELLEIEALNRTLGRQERAPLNFAGQVIHRVSWSAKSRLRAVGAGLALFLVVGVVQFTMKTDRQQAATVPAQSEAALVQTGAPIDDLAYPVDFELQYPRVRIYVIDPPEDLKSEGESSSIEITPGEQAQVNYLHYVSY